jgi:hypothetical protein
MYVFIHMIHINELEVVVNEQDEQAVYAVFNYVKVRKKFGIPCIIKMSLVANNYDSSIFCRKWRYFY